MFITYHSQKYPDVQSSNIQAEDLMRMIETIGLRFGKAYNHDQFVHHRDPFPGDPENGYRVYFKLPRWDQAILWVGKPFWQRPYLWPGGLVGTASFMQLPEGIDNQKLCLKITKLIIGYEKLPRRVNTVVCRKVNQALASWDQDCPKY